MFAAAFYLSMAANNPPGLWNSFLADSIIWMINANGGQVAYCLDTFGALTWTNIYRISLRFHVLPCSHFSLSPHTAEVESNRNETHSVNLWTAPSVYSEMHYFYPIKCDFFNRMWNKEKHNMRKSLKQYYYFFQGKSFLFGHCPSHKNSIHLN